MSSGDQQVAIAVRGLVKRFRLPRGELEVLRGVDLEVAERESVSIRGESGSGKSTLLNVLAGLERRDAGDLFWGGVAVPVRPGRRAARLRGRWLGMVFQSYYLVPELTAVDNVALAARIAGRSGRATRKEARELLARLGLEDRCEQMPTRLSGGERQRVAVARALINRPAVVLADEPTGNLDEATAGAVMELLLEVTPEYGAALVLVTHHPGFAGWTNRSLILEGGELNPSTGAVGI